MSELQFEGFGQRAGGVGRRPALVVVDMNYGFTDPESPLVCELDDTIAAIARLLDAMRRADLPVVYTTVSYGEGDKVTAKAFIDKVPVLLTLAAGSRWVEIDDRLAPRPTEPVLNKLFASAFFGTALGSLLASHGCDSVIVTGASTVPREAVGDRNPAAHDATLYDIDLKYGDVVSLEECLEALEELAAAHAR
jgi:maleamate amidohydrolase